MKVKISTTGKTTESIDAKDLDSSFVNGIISENGAPVFCYIKKSLFEMKPNKSRKRDVPPSIYGENNTGTPISIKALEELSTPSADGMYYENSYLCKLYGIDSSMFKKLSFIERAILIKEKYSEFKNGRAFVKYGGDLLATSFLKTSGLKYNISKYQSFKDNNFKVDIKTDNFTKDLALSLDGITFGVEIETKQGLVPLHLLERCNFYPLRDGSIQGIEYTSKVLSGENGLNSIKKFIEYKELLAVSSNESFHVHVKNSKYPPTKEKAYNFYNYLLGIEEEIYSMFPPAMKNTGIFKLSGKDYTQPLKRGLGSFNSLYEWYGGEYFEGFGDNTMSHPGDPSGDHKWNINVRYKWANVIPLLFQKQNTVEFRIHPPTLDYQKIVAWIGVVSAIVSFGFSDKLKKDSSLEDAIDFFFTNKKMNDFIKHYIEGRTSYYSKSNKTFKGSDLTGEKGTLTKRKILAKAIGNTELKTDNLSLFIKKTKTS